MNNLQLSMKKETIVNLKKDVDKKWKNDTEKKIWLKDKGIGINEIIKRKASSIKQCDHIV